METLQQQETKAFLAIAEALKAATQQLADANKRIADLEQLLRNK